MTTTIRVPSDANFPSTGAAGLSKVNDEFVLTFDDSTSEDAIFELIAPSDWASGTLSARIHYNMASATTGNVVWEVSIEAIAEGESVAAASYDTANSLTDAVQGTAANLGIATITCSNKDSVASGEKVRVRVRRAGGNGSDSATGDAYLRRLELTAA